MVKHARSSQLAAAVNQACRCCIKGRAGTVILHAYACSCACAADASSPGINAVLAAVFRPSSP